MKHIFFSILFGALAGALAAILVLMLYTPTEHQLIKEFYDVETAVHVSPHHLRKHIADNTFFLVDLRSQEEYEREHIVGAVNIPAYSSPDKSAYGDVERIVASFRTLEQQHPDKEFIVYCYSSPCMTGRKIGQILADHGIYVKHLGIGWNEWRHHWTLWNHEHEWNQTSVLEYVATGAQPGTFNGTVASTTCSIEANMEC